MLVPPLQEIMLAMDPSGVGPSIQKERSTLASCAGGAGVFALRSERCNFALDALDTLIMMAQIPGPNLVQS